MDPATFVVSDEEQGSRLDSFLASKIEEISRTRLQRAIDDSDVLVNDRPAKPSYRVHSGDQIDVDLPEPSPTELLPEAIPLNIVYEDADLIVVDKPAGLVVHPGSGIQSGTLANALAYHFNQLSGIAGSVRPGVVHRLDRETSGLLLAAKNDFAHERLSDQFRDRRVFKRYLGLVYGRVAEDRGEIKARIGRSPRNRTRMAVLSGDAGRTAHSIFEVATRYHDFTLLRIQIRTGRTHQIRVHMAHIGHPVVGDSAYGGGRESQIKSTALRQEIGKLG